MCQDKPFDVFLSHNSVDKPWAIQLKRSLEGRGLRVWLDRDEIRPGDLFVGALESGIQQSKAVVLVVSPESARSGWVREEYSRAIDLAQGSDSPLQLIPAILRDAELPGFLKSRNWVDFRDASLFEESIERLVWGVTGKKPDDSSHIPKKKHALLDRRLTTELLVLLSQPHPPDPVVSGGAFQTLFSLAVFEQTLVEDHYGSTLASFVSSKEPRLGSCLLLIPPDREGDRDELLDVVEDAGDEWARDTQVQIARDATACRREVPW